MGHTLLSQTKLSKLPVIFGNVFQPDQVKLDA